MHRPMVNYEENTLLTGPFHIWITHRRQDEPRLWGRGL